MPDPFLTAHRCSAPRTYTLAGDLYPVSLRDQLVRGEMLIHRLVGSGQIGRGSDVVIIGAGGAGVAAAMCAAVKHGCAVHLVDEANRLFSLQADCTTRSVHPTLYDFPANHWRVGRYPYSGGGDTPWRLAWDRPGVADRLVGQWRDQFDAFGAGATEAGGSLNFVGGSKADGFRVDPSGTDGFVEVDIDYEGGMGRYSPYPVKASAVIWATGFGSERRYLRGRDPGSVPEKSWGHPFWGNDPFEKPHLAIVAPAEPSVVISGSGDGALQDFLRIVVRPDPSGKPFDTRVLYDNLFGAGKLELSPNQSARLRNAADRQSRAHLWGIHRHDHGPLQELHRAYIEVVDELQKRDPARFAHWVAAVLKPDLPALRLIHSCDHFAQCYPLNRLLVLVLKKHLDANPGEHGPIFLAGHKVTEIVSADAGHTCDGCNTPCHGATHVVRWQECPSCEVAPQSGVIDEMRANVLVLRHGADLADLPAERMPPQARQMLPYDPLLYDPLP